MDLYAQELKVWKECAAFREVLGEVSEEAAAETAPSEGAGRSETLSCKMPGGFEW
jgi:hypothetical protein